MVGFIKFRKKKYAIEDRGNGEWWIHSFHRGAYGYEGAIEILGQWATPESVASEYFGGSVITDDRR